MEYTNHSLPNFSLGCWDLHSLGFLNADISYTENSAPSLMLPAEDNYSNFLSTGYLEDALIEFSIRFKRRRLMLYSSGQDNDDHQDHHYASLDDDLSCWANWSENYGMQSEDDFCHASLLTHDMHYAPELQMEKSAKEITKEAINFFPGGKTLLLEQAAISGTPKIMEIKNSYSTGLAHYNYSSDTYSTDSSSISDEREKMSKRKAVMTASTTPKGTTKKMVYPFGLVKPGGEEGDITLKDINKRILMPPTRPLKHPVGDFACRPGVSPHGPGLSGKAVVTLTRIHTHGRGTITIIRTKG